MTGDPTNSDLSRRKNKAKVIIAKLRKLIPDPKIALIYSNNWELLVAVILSAQCTDKMVNRVTEDLFKKYRTLEDYYNARSAEFEKDIWKTGFYKNKTKSILSAARVIRDEYEGTIPKTIEEMLTIPGVGRKTANVVLGNAYGIVEGIAVDTHVKRLAQQLGLTKNSDPEKIERDLMGIIPKKDWFVSTYLFIEYGRRYCTARPHDHSKCPLASYYVR